MIFKSNCKVVVDEVDYDFVHKSEICVTILQCESLLIVLSLLGDIN